MTRRIELRPDAAEDLAEACDWYESEREGLGERFLASVAEMLDDIASRPELGPVWDTEAPTRRRVLRRFPYVVFYRFTPDAVEILAVAHAKRRPGYWK